MAGFTGGGTSVQRGTFTTAAGTGTAKLRYPVNPLKTLLNYTALVGAGSDAPIVQLLSDGVTMQYTAGAIQTVEWQAVTFP